MKKLLQKYIDVFVVPITVLAGIALYFLLSLLKSNQNLKEIVIVVAIVAGSFQLFWDTLKSILNKSLALDYIAIFAIILGLATKEFVAASIIVLMLAGGNALEKYANKKAKSSLNKLKDRIPNVVSVIKEGNIEEIDISLIKVGDKIIVRKGEVVGLDGMLVGNQALIDESSLTGESYAVEKLKNDYIRSGTVNVGDSFELNVTKTSNESTYKKITDLVTKAQNQKTVFIKLADKYSIYFTIVTFFIALSSYLLTQDLNRVLSVLVIATPCPLILATPVALIGGVNSASKKNIVVKNLEALELLDGSRIIIFDKTGTITLGIPNLTRITLKSYDENEILKISEALERNSLHPFAKAIVSEVKQKKLDRYFAEDVREILGKGITGRINGKTYLLTKTSDSSKTSVELFEDTKLIAELFFEDVIKNNSKSFFENLKKNGYKIIILSGDSKKRVQELLNKLGVEIEFKSNIMPEEKLNFIQNIKKTGKVIMVGDGINDAPALASANVGLVYSHQEYTASTEAGDVILLKNDLESVSQIIYISNKTMGIARQSIYIGLGLSTLGMIFASFGFIVPVIGAILQELIDVGVIFNSLRSADIKYKNNEV